MRTSLLVFMLILVGSCTATADGSEQIPVEVMDTADDGVTFVYLLKEQIQASRTFKLTSFCTIGHLRLYVNVLKIAGGNQIAISSTWTYMPSNSFYATYLQSGITTVGVSNQRQAIDSCLATGDKSYRDFMADIEAARKYIAEQDAKAKAAAPNK